MKTAAVLSFFALAAVSQAYTVQVYNGTADCSGEPFDVVDDTYTSLDCNAWDSDVAGPVQFSDDPGCTLFLYADQDCQVLVDQTATQYQCYTPVSSFQSLACMIQ